MVTYDGFCRTVVATEEGVAGVFQVVCRPLLVVVAGATRPYGTFVQEDHVFRDTAIPNDFIQTPKFCDWYKISPGNAVKTAPASK